MKINPVYKKELRIGVRTIKTALIILGYNGLLALFGLFAFYATFEYGSRYGGTVNYAKVLELYAIIAAVEFGLVLFTVPALTAGSISGEREKQTLDILLTSKLTPMQVILGKLASSISIMILLAFSSLPIISLVFSIGGVTFLDLLEFMALIIITAIYIGSIGIFFSCLFKKTTAATVSTYGALLFLALGTFFIIAAIVILKDMKAAALVNQTDYIRKSPDAGYWILILLVNPAMTCFSMIENQIGTGSRLVTFLREFGVTSDWIESNWFFISVAIQGVLSLIFIYFSSRLLNPLKEKRRFKKKD
ncbi:ABC transporter permease [Anaerocolumna aminovalerica]|jgi:ABC-type transport system involved in multi-copper enzyme maturation permease subunit|uniref:ABC transporter permease n=1 Tax=Anaerocolumna aminovalerica TaxID=1527 RepID=UPI000BE28EEC|nr:ABC transporter permease subunit [Anaerocolumna aminovalerica]